MQHNIIFITVECQLTDYILKTSKILNDFVNKKSTNLINSSIKYV